MAAVTGCTPKYIEPGRGIKKIAFLTPSTADSADTVDISSDTVTGGPVLATIYGVYASDLTTGDAVTCTWSTTTITLDAGGGTANHQYYVEVWGI
jgi:hypothetical protein